MLITTAAAAALSSRGRGSSGSAYIDAGVLDDSGNTNLSLYRASKNNRVRNFINGSFFRYSKIFGSGIAAFFLLVMSVFTVGGGFFGHDVISSFAAQEDELEQFTNDFESDAQSTIDRLTSEFDGVDENDRSTWDALESLRPHSNSNNNNMGYVIHRLFVPGYMNTVEYASAPWGTGDDRRIDEGWLCENPSSNPIQGTPLYHNCDIPNVMAQLGQWGFGSISKQGVQNANMSDPRTGFGVPHESLLPRGNVPANLNSSTSKYTGLEKYGYNLNYTTYVGEWDDIGVMVEARALQNFSGFDRLKLGANAVWDGISGSLEGAAQGLDQGWSNAIDAGGVRYVTAPVEALWGAFIGGTTGFTSSMVRTFLDTSDYNVVSTGSWYRRQYPETLYGNVRQLTDEEIAEVADRRQRFAMLDGYWNALSEFDIEGMDEIAALDPAASNSPLGDLPRLPTEAEIQEYEDAVEEYNDQREAWQDYQRELRQYNASTSDSRTEPTRPNFSNPGPTAPEQPYEFETIDEWIDDNSGFFGNASNTDRGDFRACLTTRVHRDEPEELRDCWNNQYTAAMGSLIAENLDLLSRSIERNFFSSFIGRITGGSAGNSPTSSNMELPANHPFNRFVCPDSGGGIYQDGRMTDVRNLYVSPNSSETNREAYNCPTRVRAPIQDGLFGSGYTSQWDNENGNTPPGPDTRREMFDGYKALGAAPIFDGLNTASNFFLSITLRTTAFSNFLIDLSFNPPLQWLGFDEVASGLIGSFRDSMFFPLSVIVVAVGAVIIMYGHVRKREMRQAWTSIAMMFVVSISGVLIMDDPDRLVEMSDQIPSTIENGFAAGIFSTMSSSGDAICAPTGTPRIPEGQEYGNVEDFNSNAMGTSLVVRAMMCETWRNFAFAPWVYGQFGTGYQDLNVSRMQNTNSALVGNANVNLGGGASTRNWALYQLDATTTGTVTTQGAEENVGSVNPNMYRLVDLQAGPNNAAGADTRYFERWSGNDGFGRTLDSFLGMITAVVGMAAIFVYVLIKLEYTLFVTMLLIIMPIMFLIGLEPMRGRSTLRKYFGSLVGAMMKRIMAVFFLALMLSLMSHATTAASGSYFHVSLILMLISIIFIMNRNRFMEMVEGAGNAVGGGTLGQDGHKMPLGSMFSGKFGKTVGAGLAGGVAGVATGGIMGSVDGAGSAFKDSRKSGENMGRSLLSAAGGGLKHGTIGAAKSGTRSGVTSAKRAVTIMRSAGGMGLLNKALDMNENLNYQHYRQMRSGRFDDASRRMGAKQVGEAIKNKQKDLEDINNTITDLEGQGVDKKDPLMKKALEAQDEIQSKLAELKATQDRALYADDWNASEIGDLNSASIQKELRKEGERQKKVVRKGEKGKGNTFSAAQYNEGASSYILTDPDDPDQNYLQETAEQDRQRSARHGEIMSQRERISDEIRQSVQEKNEKTLDSTGNQAWRHYLKKEGYESAEQMKEHDAALYYLTESRVDQAVETRRKGLEAQTEKLVAQAFASEQFKHSRYIGEFEYDRISINQGLSDAHRRGFEVSNNVKIDGLVKITDQSTGAVAEIKVDLDENGNPSSASVVVKDSSGRVRDLGEMSTSGNMKAPFEAAYKELGEHSVARKTEDTAGGSIDEEKAYANYRAERNRRAYRTYEIPEWAKNEREHLAEQMNDATTPQEKKMVQDKINKVDDIERRAAAQQAKIENTYHGGTAEDAGIDATNLGVGAREKAARIGEAHNTAQRSSLVLPNKQENKKNRVSRKRMRRSSAKLYDSKNTREQVNKIKNEQKKRQRRISRSGKSTYIRGGF